MRVGLGGHIDCGVPEDLLHDLELDALLEQERSCAIESEDRLLGEWAASFVADLIAASGSLREAPGQTGTDPFAAGSGYPQDTTATCNVVLSDVGATSSVLLNVCSYPSSEPNSDPSGCVVVPHLPRLTLLKTVSNDSGGTALATAWTLVATGPQTISGAIGTAAVTTAAVATGTYAHSGALGLILVILLMLWLLGAFGTRA